MFAATLLWGRGASIIKVDFFASTSEWRQAMQVTVEFFGIVRARAGVASTTAAGNSLGDVLVDLAARFPDLARDCIDGRCLRADFAANLGGQRFVTAPETPLCDGDIVLLLSLDAGG